MLLIFYLILNILIRLLKILAKLRSHLLNSNKVQPTMLHSPTSLPYMGATPEVRL